MEDRVHAMAMVLGAVGQNNFSNRERQRRRGLIEKRNQRQKMNGFEANLWTINPKRNDQILRVMRLIAMAISFA